MMTMIGMLQSVAERPSVHGLAAHGLAAGMALVALGLVTGSPTIDRAHADPAPTLLWQRTSGTAAYDSGRAVAIDSAGDIVAGGATYGAMGRTPEKGNGDGLVVKYSPDGAVKWRRQPASARQDFVFRLATDFADNIVAVGQTMGALAGTPRGETDIFVVKYASDGRTLWKRQFGTTDYDSAAGVATDAVGNIIIVGAFGGDAFVVNSAPDGTERWRRVLDSGAADAATGVATDPAGNIVVVGRTQGSLGGANKGDTDIFIAVYSGDGTLQWIKQPGTEADDGALGVAVGVAGRIFVVGFVSDSTGISGGLLTAYSNDGAEQWRHVFPGFDYYVEAVAIDGAGNVVIGGTPDLPSTLGFIASFTPAGARQWARQVPNVYGIWGVATDRVGHLAAVSERGKDGRSYDVFVAKYELP